MRIKLASICFLIADIVLFFTAGYMLANKPPRGAPRSIQVGFAIRSDLVILVLLGSLFTTVLLVLIWAQKVREEYREQSRENLQSLIESTLRDHDRKKS